MEWLPLAVIGILIIILGLYFIVKWAVKDALKEYFNDRVQSAGSNRRFCGAKRTRCGASGLNLYLLKSADTL